MVKPATNYKGATDEGLADLIQQWEKDRSRHMDMLNAIEADLANFRTELRRRKLDAFWQANEGLRLEVGDRLLVTEEAIAEISSKERNWPKGSIRAFTTSITFTVKHINANNSSITVRFLDSSETTLPLDIARRMRIAYLQAHGEAQP